MKNELSCAIVRDLLPSYIDELASTETVEAVESHLKQCRACQLTYEGMKEGKEDYERAVHSQKTNTYVEAEKQLLKKINHKVNKKVKKAVAAGIIGIVGTIGIMQILFNMPLKTLPVHEVTVKASVYPLKEIVTGKEKYDSVHISKGEEGDKVEYYSIDIPDMPNSSASVSKEMVEEGDYVSYITMEAPYLLTDVDWGFETIDGKQIMYVKSFKTTLLGNKAASQNMIMPILQFKKIDRIIYTGEAGTQEILWQNEAK
ncbi:zf-HC2 domain-containing protein [Cellulosilyticum ruminicola]|uniref:zf-HC2 domain-containing protein n=1 Tax=Cellulosilyticum ruminicola TaxID=425254 RepID=UPI0006D0F21F|nr:zf-HC2 domain-containing protein [Cellulosilyticum ruminicola]